MELAKVSEDPALKAYTTNIQNAVQQGNFRDMKRLGAEARAIRLRLEAAKCEELRTAATPPVRADFLAWRAALAALSDTNLTERAAIWRQLAPKLGQLPLVDGQPAPGADDYGAGGTVGRHGLLMEITALSLNEAATGLPALADWLCQHDCRSIRYEFVNAEED